jgi:hypothetical protein
LLATRSVVQGAACGRLQAGSYTQREPVNPRFFKNTSTATREREALT